MIKTAAALMGVIAVVPAVQAQTTLPGPNDPFFVSDVFLDSGSFEGRGGFGIFFDANAYQVPFASNYGPSSTFIDEVPDVEFDSYVAFGGAPSTLDNEAITPPATPEGFDEFSGFFEQPGTIGGALFSNQEPGQSQVNPASGLQSFFFARLTLPAGVQPGGSIGVNTTEFAETLFLSVEVIDPFSDGETTEPDPAIVPRGFPEFREFAVRARKTESEKELTVFSTTSIGQPTALFDVYDFYIEIVPAPGAAAGMLALGAMTLTRRRR